MGTREQCDECREFFIIGQEMDTCPHGQIEDEQPHKTITKEAALEKPLLEKTWLLEYIGKDGKLKWEDNTYIHIDDIIAAVKKYREGLLKSKDDAADYREWAAMAYIDAAIDSFDEIFGKVK